jgi:hypothetical protein
VAVDTVTGFQVVADAASILVVADAARSDVLNIGASTSTAWTVTNAAKMTVTGTSLSAALLQAASLKAADGTDVNNVLFHFGGDTYAYQDLGTAGLSDDDALVKLSGTLNLDLLLTSNTIV